jgi:hypothetical protein
MIFFWFFPSSPPRLFTCVSMSISLEDKFELRWQGNVYDCLIMAKYSLENLLCVCSHLPNQDHLLTLPFFPIFPSVLYHLHYNLVFLFWEWAWDLDSGFRVLIAGALPLESHLQHIFLWLFCW